MAVQIASAGKPFRLTLAGRLKSHYAAGPALHAHGHVFEEWCDRRYGSYGGKQ